MAQKKSVELQGVGGEEDIDSLIRKIKDWEKAVQG